MREINEGNVARYCKPTSLDDNTNPTSASFRLGDNETYLSVYLLEYFIDFDQQQQIQRTKRAMENRLKLGKNGLLAILNIDNTIEYILNEASEYVVFREQNLPHAGIYHSSDDLLISELLSECVLQQHVIKNIK